MSGLRGLDTAAVGAWMVANIENCVAPIEFSLIAGGHSNLTYGSIDAMGVRRVVRRGPLGRATGGAHDMAREHRVIAALAATDVPVPGALGLCADDSVNGSSFYVMSHVDGAVLDNRAAADRALPGPAARRRAGEQVVDVLAAMHRVEADAVGLGSAARREDFLARQIKRFGEMWVRNVTRELPEIETLARRLEQLAPAQRYTGLVHGDYRIGNVMIGGDGTLAAVLDWELWTLGDVLADVGFLLNNWYEPDDPTPMVFMELPPTTTGDFGSRADALARYAAQSGFDITPIEYYRAFQHWRMAVLAEGVKRRYEQSEMASTNVDMAHLNRRVLDLVALSAAHLDVYEAAAG